jgi:hypothetical protein
MTGTSQSHAAAPLSVAVWWLATVLTLVVLDDLTFGPAFWALSRLAGPLVAVVAIFAIYVPAQLLILRGATSDAPGRVTAFFLRRLDLERRNPQLARNEEQLRSKVVGTSSALLLSLVIGGVLPPLLLWRRGADRRFVLRLGIVTSVVYAAEFAVLHGFVPGTL